MWSEFSIALITHDNQLDSVIIYQQHFLDFYHFFMINVQLVFNQEEHNYNYWDFLCCLLKKKSQFYIILLIINYY